MVRTFVQSLSLLVMFFLASTAFAKESPDALVERVSHDVIQALQGMNKDKDDANAEVFKLIDKIVLPHFDFVKMSELIMVRHWSSMSQDQRQRFVTAFQDLLVRTYANALLNYRDQKVEVTRSSMLDGGKEAIVQMRIVQSTGAADIPLSYRLYNSDSGWKVYDVTIERVSFVNNFRRSYGRVAKSQGVEALLGKLENRSSSATP